MLIQSAYLVSLLKIQHGRQNLTFDVLYLRSVTCNVTFDSEITSGCRPWLKTSVFGFGFSSFLFCFRFSFLDNKTQNENPPKKTKHKRCKVKNKNQTWKKTARNEKLKNRR